MPKTKPKTMPKTIPKTIPKTMPKEHDYGSAQHFAEIFDKEFMRESDRAAVILAAALLDNALESLLKMYFVPCVTSNDQVFDGPNAPLSTFCAKIDLAYRIGLISSKFCRDLHLIRKIRNEFAHNISGCSFESCAVKSKVLELAKSSDIIKNWPDLRKRFPKKTRGDFQMIVSWMLFYLNQTIEGIIPLKMAELEWGYFADLKIGSK